MIHLFDLVIAAQPSLSDEAMAKLALHAAAIAGFIRLIVMALRSPFLGFLWTKIPVAVRPLVLLLLGALAAAFDSIALGTPVAEAFFAAVGGLFGAIGSHEVQQRIVPKKR